MNEHDQYKAQSRAKYAQDLKDNPVWREAWTMLRATMVDKVQKLKADDTNGLVEVKRTLDNLNRLEKVIDKYIETGKIVEERQSRLNIFKK